jgi:hypothetical protein
VPFSGLLHAGLLPPSSPTQAIVLAARDERNLYRRQVPPRHKVWPKLIKCVFAGDKDVQYVILDLPLSVARDLDPGAAVLVQVV